METESQHFDDLLSHHPAVTLLSGKTCIFSHCCRLVLREKAVECNIEYLSMIDDADRVDQLNPYGETPILIDRELTLYDTMTIIEYMDERFPHPPLMPVIPISRAKTRLMIMRLIHDWLAPLKQLDDNNSLPGTELKQNIRDGLLAIAPLFEQHPFFMSHDYGRVDAYIVPLLWRLPALGINLPKQADSLLQYADRMFKRQAFISSLSTQEATLR